MTTLDRQTIYSIEDVIAKRPFGETSPVDEDVLAPTNQLALGAIQRTATATGKTATVKAGEDIRPALNSLKSAGGGTLILLAGTHRPTYDINITSKIRVVGEGLGQTIIDFTDTTNGIYCVGTSSDVLEYFSLENFTVTQSGSDYPIDVDYADNWEIKNVEINNSKAGFRVRRSQNYLMFSCRSLSNLFIGFHFDTTTGSSRDQVNGQITNCTSDSNSDGFKIGGGGTSSLLESVVFMNCLSDSNGSEGFHFDYGATNRNNVKFISCIASNNTSDGFLLDAPCVVVGCEAFDNSGDGFEALDDVTLVGNSAYNNTGKGFKFENANNRGVVVGNTVIGQTGSETLTDFMALGRGDFVARMNDTDAPTTLREIFQMISTSVTDVTEGACVVFDPNSPGDSFNTTTTQGDNKVLGLNGRFTKSQNENGNVHIHGYSTVLKVNGTDDIAIGDYLATYSSAGIAAKARPGDQVFAIALEAYTTNDSNGVIDAYILPWRFPLVENSDLRAIEESSLNYRPVEVVDSQYIAVGNVGTGEDNLMTYTLPGGSLAVDGETVRITAYGLGANNANSKTVKMYFGSQLLDTTALSTTAGSQWKIEAIVTRRSATTQRANVSSLSDNGSGAALNITQTSPAEPLSGDVVIKCTGEAVADDDIEQYGMIIELLHQ